MTLPWQVTLYLNGRGAPVPSCNMHVMAYLRLQINYSTYWPTTTPSRNQSCQQKLSQTTASRNSSTNGVKAWSAMLSSVIPCFWARKQASSAVQNNDLPVGPGKQMRSVSRSKRKGIASFDSARAMPDRSSIIITSPTISGAIRYPDQKPR